jgi:hypothetical protein
MTISRTINVISSGKIFNEGVEALSSAEAFKEYEIRRN